MEQLPFLRTVCNMIAYAEESSLHFLLVVGQEDVHVAGRASPMVTSRGNAVALLFETALDDDVERPYLLDLAETLLGIESEEEEPLVDDEEVEEDEETPQRRCERPHRRHHELLSSILAEDYDFFDRIPDDDETDSEEKRRQQVGDSSVLEEEEPTPQKAGRTATEDPLLAFWRAHQSTREESPEMEEGPVTRPTTQQRRDKLTSSRKGKRSLLSRASTRPPTQATKVRPLPRLTKDSLRARHSLEVAHNERSFWKNRLKMLHREVDKAQHRVDVARAKDSKFEVAKVMNETVEAQLQQELRRDLVLRQEKAQAIRAHKSTHRDAVRQAQSQIIQNKIEAGRLMKVHQRNHQAIVESLRKEEFEHKCAKRAEVQQTKVIAMVKRLREGAMKQEEIRRNYRMRVQYVRDEERRCEEESMQYVEESSKLVSRIRKLKGVEASIASTSFALRSANTSMYNVEK